MTRRSEPSSDPYDHADNPTVVHITWTFPGNALTEGREWTLEWFDGELYPSKEIRSLYTESEYPPESAMVIGTEGAMLIAHGRSPLLLPQDKFTGYPRPKIGSRNHYHHFVEACLGGEKTESHFAQTGPMTEAILLGTVAIRTPGERLEWDAKRMRFPNRPDAERHLKRRYREGWRVAGT